MALLAVLFCMSAPLLANDGSAAAVDVRKMDGIIQDLKQETLEFNRQASLNELAILYPDATRATLYAGIRADRFLIQSISVSLNGGQPFRYEFPDRNARSLVNSGGLHLLFMQNLAPGSHKLRAEYSGRFEGVAENSPPVSGSTEYVFVKNRNPVEIEISVNNGSAGKPQFAVTSWNNSTFNAAAPPPTAVTVTPSSRKRPK